MGQPQDVFVADVEVNPFVRAEEDGLSTFAMDVDSASFTFTRAWLAAGQMPLAGGVRVEEFVNALEQDYAPPATGTWAIHLDGAATPFTTSPDNRVLRIGLQAREVADEDRPDANLVFVIDTSGSMDLDNRIGLVKRSLHTLVDALRPADTIAIVEYGSRAGTVLDRTAVAEPDAIHDAIDRLRAGGSTNADAGLRLGYGIAERDLDPARINRVVLLSDGVANVGTDTPEGILAHIREAVDTGVKLVTVGVGMDNYQDVLMERLADDGDGFYAYVDDDREAVRLFTQNLTGTLLTVAEEAKVQVAFDPDTVVAYRLLGFENRDIADEDFHNDAVDAGEIGAGHSVTALYEIELARGADEPDPLATVTVRWLDPDSGEVRERTEPVVVGDIDIAFERASLRLRQDVVAAAFAEVLRGSEFARGITIAALTEAARPLAALEDDRAADLRVMLTQASELQELELEG